MGNRKKRMPMIYGKNAMPDVLAYGTRAERRKLLGALLHDRGRLHSSVFRLGPKVIQIVTEDRRG